MTLFLVLIPEEGGVKMSLEPVKIKPDPVSGVMLSDVRIEGTNWTIDCGTNVYRFDGVTHGIISRGGVPIQINIGGPIYGVPIESVRWDEDNEDR